MHSSLELRQKSSDDCNRGVFATKQSIAKGDLLIRLPVPVAVHGQSFPAQYEYNGQRRQASPWLRCLAAYLQVSTRSKEISKLEATYDGSFSTDKIPYVKSLPVSYETLWQWSDTELDNFLAGTSPPTTAAVTSESSSWKVDEAALRQRYCDQIRPYLVHCAVLLRHSTDDNVDSVEEQEFQDFATACQVLSTRAFHMDNHTAAVSNNDTEVAYSGPYLLPVMDLLNHASSTSGQSCTSLQLRGGDFIMVAERKIAVSEEILHSYGDHLTSSHFLVSFGFVPDCMIQRAAAAVPSSDHPILATSPAVLSKTRDIWESCWHLIESGFPKDLAAFMQDNMDDEAWPIKVDRSRTADYVLEDILLVPPTSIETSSRSAVDVLQLQTLTNELVTAACIPFLPKCAYSEITDRTLLDGSILEDYFLGKLVGAALLKTIKRKFATYAPIPSAIYTKIVSSPTTAKSFPVDDGANKDDVGLLRQLLLIQSTNAEQDNDVRDCPNDNCEVIRLQHKQQQRSRLMYALTIRIEEKKSLAALAREVTALLASLDSESSGGDVADSVRENTDDESSCHKKQRIME